MSDGAWIKSFPVAITVCDTKGTIIEMNEKALRGRDLIGKSILDCHPDKVKSKVEKMLAGEISDCHISERSGKKRLQYKAPWYKDGVYAGIVELTIELPPEMF